jgi:adenosylmethionine-8-amino-7-oxononanoate aminotransferase
MPETVTSAARTSRGTDRAEAARDHLWMHFARHSTYADGGQIPIIVHGEGCRIWDDRGCSYLDGLAGLFVVQAGHGRRELAEAAARQASELAFFPIWGYAHPAAIDLAERLAHYAPGNLNRVFFTTGGGEAVESAWKLAKQYFKLAGKPGKTKVISRNIAYHGTPQGALAITSLPALRAPYEPLVPGAFKVPNTNAYRAPEGLGGDLKAFGCWAADRVEEAILFEGADTVAAVFVEPVQNAGGCFPPPPGYFERLREICDRHDVLLVSDEVICAFGRIGSMFACDDFGYVPDIITCAKGMTSGYSPIGAMIASERLFEPFIPARLHVRRAPGVGRGRDGQAGHLRAGGAQRPREGAVAGVPDHPGEAARPAIVGDVRGEGFFFDDEESERLLRGFLAGALYEGGLYCRADDRGDPVIQLSPPLTAGPAEFDEIEQILRGVLTEAWSRL